MKDSNAKSPHYNAGLLHRPSQMALRPAADVVEEEMEMLEVDHLSQPPWVPTLVLPEAETVEPEPAWVMAVASFLRGMSSSLRLRLLRIKRSLFSRRTSSPQLGLCHSSSAFPHATSGSVGCVPRSRGAPRVVRLQTELYLTVSPSMAPPPSPQGTLCVPLPRATTIQFGNRLGLLRLPSRQTCLCLDDGTPLMSPGGMHLIKEWEGSALD